MDSPWGLGPSMGSTRGPPGRVAATVRGPEPVILQTTLTFLFATSGSVRTHSSAARPAPCTSRSGEPGCHCDIGEASRHVDAEDVGRAHAPCEDTRSCWRDKRVVDSWLHAKTASRAIRATDAMALGIGCQFDDRWSTECCWASSVIVLPQLSFVTVVHTQRFPGNPTSTMQSVQIIVLPVCPPAQQVHT